ncbi:MAG TPA: nuclear transport factor 2 family protein [Bryobacteraceae bacterium]|jgi:predicted SnoaL-like aldol condensation-catalyzing enzyme|nr:nuclear transport factor 2 family protein [Bryobacteraceae bacterium]
MKLSKWKIWAGAIVLAAGVSTMLAESINPPTSSQTAPMNGQEKKNLDMVLSWWREVLDGGHLELTSKYQAEDYIQHNPNVNTGRAGFVDFFSKFAKPKNPIPDKLTNPPVVTGAKGDYVWLIFETERKDPRDESKTYHSNSFDVLRIQNGKVQEHWDSAQKMAGSGAVKTGVSPKPPMEWKTGKLSKDEEHNLALGTEELKDMLQYGHLELADKTMDPGYIQHNPNVPQGRDGFKQFMSRIPGRRPEDAKPIKPEWLNPPVLTLVNGPYVLFMWDRDAKDPDDASHEYKWNHFDVVRVENGLIKEHWDEAVIARPQAGGKKQ